MTSQSPTQCTGDRKKQALIKLSELIKKHPDKTRKQLLQQVQIEFDLTPKECEFLDKNFQS